MHLTVVQKIEGYLLCNVCAFQRCMDHLPLLLARLPLDNECVMQTYNRHEEFGEIYRKGTFKKAEY